ncbi:hypothetical protein AAZX31_12G166600 [Glycine max]
MLLLLVLFSSHASFSYHNSDIVTPLVRDWVLFINHVVFFVFVFFFFLSSGTSCFSCLISMAYILRVAWIFYVGCLFFFFYNFFVFFFSCILTPLRLHFMCIIMSFPIINFTGDDFV